MRALCVYNEYITVKQGGIKMKLIRKHLLLPKEMNDAIIKYQKENMLTTFTAALQELIRKGLEK